MSKEHLRIRLAACLVLLGLVVEALTLRWSHPTAFFVYAGLGLLLWGLGALIFLSSLLGGDSAHHEATPPSAKPVTTPSDEKSPAP